jgi:hypothetical protein
MRTMTAILFASISLSCATTGWATETDWKKVDLVFGREAAVSGPVHRYGLPGSDLKVSLDGVQLKAGFALGGWVAFEPMGDATMMMGDLVLTEAEINPVMTKAAFGRFAGDRRAQPPAARQPSHLLHACLRHG